MEFQDKQIPVWNGKPESFSHFVHEVKWTLSATKRGEKPLLAAKIVRKALQSGIPALVQLMYKLEPSDYKSESDIQKLIAFLEKSPLNRQALPDAGNKIGSYYRRLQRHHNESVPSFLIREDKIHDEMLQALQRLLRDKELDFEGYETSLEELKMFCGMRPGESLYYGSPDDEASVAAEDDAGSAASNTSRTATPSRPGVPVGESTARQSSSSSTPGPESEIKGNDLIERLMQKGLLPLAALDIVRGWMLLEMSTLTGDDRRLVRAATRNKLGYMDIKSALLSMYEEQTQRIPINNNKGGKNGKGSVYFGDYVEPWEIDPDDPNVYPETGLFAGELGDYGDYNGGDPWSDDAWWNTTWSGTDDAWYNDMGSATTPETPSMVPQDPETVHHLLKEQDDLERQFNELQALTAESERNLAEARKAVSLAAKDRGWNQPPQQRQPRFTSTYPVKGKKGGKGKSLHYGEEANWIHNKSNGFKGKGKYKSSFGKSNFGKNGKGGKSYELQFHEHDFYPIFSADGNPDKLSPSESVVDTGATATAGGRWAVEQLCAAIMGSRPEASIVVHTDDRPWFRFGSGSWGQALFKVVIKVEKLEVMIYSLPSPAVPVLTGMRELEKFDAILGCKSGRCLINGRQKTLRRTPKKHLIIDYLKDVFPEQPRSSNSNPSSSSAYSARSLSERVQLVSKPPQRTTTGEVQESQFAEVHDLWTFELHDDFIDHEMYTIQEHIEPNDVFADDTTCNHLSMAQHMNISEDNILFLTSSSFSDKPEKRVRFDPTLSTETIAVNHDGTKFEGRSEANVERSSERAASGNVKFEPYSSNTGQFKGKVKSKPSQEQDSVRPYESYDDGRTRSSNTEGDLALLRNSCKHVHFEQPICPVDGMFKVRTEGTVCTGSGSTRTVHPYRPDNECDRGSSEAQGRRLGGRRDDRIGNEGSHRYGGEGEDYQEQRQEEQWLSQQGEGEGISKVGSSEDSSQDDVCAKLGGRRKVSVGEGLGGGQGVEREEMGLEEAQENVQETGFEASIRTLSGEERKQLLQAADQFNVGATLASLQDCGSPFTTWEVCCSLNSTLTKLCQKKGMTAVRKTFENGYDIEKEETMQKLLDDRRKEKPNRSWWSLKCAPWTNIQNLNQRNEVQVEMLRKKRQKGRKAAKIALQTIIKILEEDPDHKFYWEWPKNAYAGWTLREMREFENYMHKIGIRLFWTEVHGCMFDVQAPNGDLLKKEWLVMNNDSDFHQHCQVKCDGRHQHRVGGVVGIGKDAVEATGYYPEKMAEMIARRWKSQWEQVRRKNYHETVEKIIFAMDETTEEEMENKKEKTLEEVTKEERDKTHALLHKLHKASGHPPNRALARLCRDRGLPKWVVEMAKQLKCPACQHSEPGGQMVIPYSLGAKPSPWQFVTLDIMDMIYPALRCKVRYMIATCVVMKFVAIKKTWQGSVGEAGTDSGKILSEVFADMWLAHRPRPAWVIVDPQTSLSAGQFVEFMQLAGVGVSVSAPEAHWQQGTIESLIRVLKRTMKRLREEHPLIDPQTCANLAVLAHNHQFKTNGFSPVQWAYGFDPDRQNQDIEPAEFNAHHHHLPYEFWQTQRLRKEAEDYWRHEQAVEAWTRLKNAAPRQPKQYQIGEWVCVWRTAAWRSKGKMINPEPRYVGPGRVALIEPAIIAENKPMIYWVLIANQVWRCSPEQLRKASEQEISVEELQKGQKFNTPIIDMLKKTTKVIDVMKEPGYPHDESSLPDQPGSQAASSQPEHVQRAQPSFEWTQDIEKFRDDWRALRKRQASTPLNVKEEAMRWKQLVSTNENRRREGLPPLMDLPELPPDEIQVEDGFQAVQSTLKPGQEQSILKAEKSYEEIMAQVELLEEKLHVIDQQDKLKEQIAKEKEMEKQFKQHLAEACDRGEEICEMVIEVDDYKQFLSSGIIYMKKMMETPKEINFRALTPEDRALVEESMARELCEVLGSAALKKVQDDISPEEVEKRCIPMRWLLIWKPLDEYKNPAAEEKPGVIRSDGLAKAKARIVLIGYKHPDLGKRDPRTGQSLLPTSSPTMSRMARNCLLQAAALDGHTIECADAKSAFLQADQPSNKNRIFTRAVPEISVALGIPEGTALEVVGQFYGLTTAPRGFWLDADHRIQKIGGKPHMIDKCVWIFTNSAGKVCGRIGTHVDDFLIAGNLDDEEWLAYRAQILSMYRWTPWKRSSFTFAGVRLRQLQDFSILLDQESFCHELEPVAISNERGRTKDDKLTAREISQCRGLIMKAQWRAIQSAPQYCCRIGLAASSLTKGTLDVLKEANSIMKELKKTSQDCLIFHSFRTENLTWRDVVFVHFGDAARGNRVDGGDTGGYITGIASPSILTGKVAPLSILDYKSWKLDRPVRGTNGSEAQALYVTEDSGWKMRLVWALMHGEKLNRVNADHLAAMVESLLVMDSRGCYDALSNSDSPFLGMNNAKTGTELMSVQRGVRDGSNCYPTWCPSDMNLSDCMTKTSLEAFKTFALWNQKKSWIIRFDSEFVAARKQQRLRRQMGKTPHALLDPTDEQLMLNEFDLDSMFTRG